MKGIYSLEINGKLYVGKDSQIKVKKRYKEHLNMLKKVSITIDYFKVHMMNLDM